MDHLDLDLILDVLAGRGGTEETEHLAACSGCREETALWERRLADLRLVESEEIGSGEEHRLRVLFRQLGPSRGRNRLIARLVRGTVGPAVGAAVRGGATELSEYRAAGFVATVQVLPGATETSYELHGCLLRGNDAVAAASAVLSRDDLSYCCCEDLDEFGEFHFSGVPAGSYSLSWVAGEDRIEIEKMAIGDGDSDAAR